MFASLVRGFDSDDTIVRVEQPPDAQRQRGGTRPGAGRKTAYPGKDLARTVYVDMTEAGRAALASLCTTHRLSRNDVLTTLVLAHASSLTTETYRDRPGVLFSPKLGQNVYAIRMTPPALDALAAAQTRTHKSASDLAEALITEHGDHETYPQVIRQAPRSRRRRARRRTQDHAA
jgi:hypothetical protein